MSALRIGVFSASLPRAGRKPGGVDVHIHRLSNRLQERGHDVRVASFSPAPADARYEPLPLRPRGLGERTLARVTLVSALYNLIDTSAFDVVHLHGDDWLYLRRGVPTVRTFHGSALFEARHATRMRRRALQLACFGGELAAARMATGSYGLIPGDGRPYRVRGALPIGVEIPPEPAPTLTRSGPPTVLFVGTWAGRKRGRVLYDAFQRHVRARVPEARLLMVCDRDPAAAAGDQAAAGNQAAARDPAVAAAGVRWLGAPDDATLARLYREAWLFCLPSSYEGFGLPYLEAMSHGTPVVATPNPGARHVLGGGRYGALVEVAELGPAIARLLLDGDARLRLAQRAAERADAFSWESALAAHERAYREAIARYAGGRGRSRFGRGLRRAR